MGNLDGTLIQAPQFAGVGYDNQRKRCGTNISLLTEKSGLPLTDMTFKGNRNDTVCAETTMNKLRVGAKRRVLAVNADKGYDSQVLRKHLRKRGIGTNISERKAKHRRKRGRKPHTDEAQFKFRAFTEQVNVWVKSYHRLRYRYERKRGGVSSRSQFLLSAHLFAEGGSFAMSSMCEITAVLYNHMRRS